MILGLYPDNTEGAVLYNGVSQRRIDRYALRRCRVGITEQEPPIVGGTILDNLTLLSDDFEADKLNRMLAILGLDKMIAAAENGAAAMLGSKKGGGVRRGEAEHRNCAADVEIAGRHVVS